MELSFKLLSEGLLDVPSDINQIELTDLVEFNANIADVLASKLSHCVFLNTIYLPDNFIGVEISSSGFFKLLSTFRHLNDFYIFNGSFFNSVRVESFYDVLLVFKQARKLAEAKERQANLTRQLEATKLHHELTKCDEEIALLENDVKSGFLRNIYATTDKLHLDEFQIYQRKGSVTWNTAELLLLAEKHPEIAKYIYQCRNEGTPTVVISPVKKKKDK